MKEVLELAFLPLASFWVMHSSLLGASKFLNDIRDTVITGVKNGVEISYDHRKVLLWDWKLSLFGTFSACGVFFLLIFWAGFYVLRKRDFPSHGELGHVLILTSFTPIIGGLLFYLCGVSDARLMEDSLDNTKKQKID